MQGVSASAPYQVHAQQRKWPGLAEVPYFHLYGILWSASMQLIRATYISSEELQATKTCIVVFKTWLIYHLWDDQEKNG